MKDADGTARFRYQTPPEIAQGTLANRYSETMDRLFESYSFVVRALTAYFQSRFPQGTRETRGAYRRATRARACDTARGLLPAATTSNLGIYATGQAYEALLMRMNASLLAEAREYSQMMLVELRKVIAGFLSRVDVEDRGRAWSGYFRNVALEMSEIIKDEREPEDSREFDLERDEVRMLDHDP